MKSYVLQTQAIYVAVSCALLVIALFPTVSQASSTKPECFLKVQTSQGSLTVKDKDDVLLRSGDTVEITWQSKNAKTALARNGKRISLSGTSTLALSTTTPFSYRFSAGHARVTCSVTVHVVSATFSDTTRTSTSHTPTLFGHASGTKSLSLQIYKQGSTNVLYTRTAIPVHNGAWKTRVSKKLKDGIYDVVLFGERGLALNTIATGTLRIGKSTHTSTQTATVNAETQFVVLPIPLLLGGTARGGTSVSLSYLQVINIGKASASVKGFRVKQNGTASTKSIIGLTVVDDTGNVQGSLGGTEDSQPFKDNEALIPTHVLILPGQMRLFTIKALLKKAVSAYTGTNLKIDVTGVDGVATTKSKFPIRGTTWTIGT